MRTKVKKSPKYSLVHYVLMTFATIRNVDGFTSQFHLYQ